MILSIFCQQLKFVAAVLRGRQVWTLDKSCRHTRTGYQLGKKDKIWSWIWVCTIALRSTSWVKTHNDTPAVCTSAPTTNNVSKSRLPSWSQPWAGVYMLISGWGLNFSTTLVWQKVYLYKDIDIRRGGRGGASLKLWVLACTVKGCGSLWNRASSAYYWLFQDAALSANCLLGFISLTPHVDKY